MATQIKKFTIKQIKMFKKSLQRQMTKAMSEHARAKKQEEQEARKEVRLQKKRAREEEKEQHIAIREELRAQLRQDRRAQRDAQRQKQRMEDIELDVEGICGTLATFKECEQDLMRILLQVKATRHELNWTKKPNPCVIRVEGQEDMEDSGDDNELLLSQTSDTETYESDDCSMEDDSSSSSVITLSSDDTAEGDREEDLEDDLPLMVRVVPQTDDESCDCGCIPGVPCAECFRDDVLELINGVQFTSHMFNVASLIVGARACRRRLLSTIQTEFRVPELMYAASTEAWRARLKTALIELDAKQREPESIKVYADLSDILCLDSKALAWVDMHAIIIERMGFSKQYAYAYNALFDEDIEREEALAKTFHQDRMDLLTVPEVTEMDRVEVIGKLLADGEDMETHLADLQTQAPLPKNGLQMLLDAHNRIAHMTEIAMLDGNIDVLKQISHVRNVIAPKASPVQLQDSIRSVKRRRIMA